MKTFLFFFIIALKFVGKFSLLVAACMLVCFINVCQFCSIHSHATLKGLIVVMFG